MSIEEELRAEIAQLKQQLAEKDKIISELQKVVAIYVSPHIPSSKKIIKEKKTDE